jgi:co-chaperonin GroES (HSP10)
MRVRDYFVVQLENTMNDSITLANGTKLYIDTKYDEFNHRVNEGEVVYTPYNYETAIESGDTIYFHHLVVINGGQKLPNYDDYYMVKFDPNAAINSQLIAYKKQDEIVPMSGWAILEAIEEKEKEEPDAWLMHLGIELVTLEEKIQSKGKIAFYSKEIQDLGLKVGDVVGFGKNMDYRFKIDGKEYYRVRAEDLLYVEERV